VSRPLRTEIAEGIYHVINRANERRTLFSNEREYDDFENLLFEGLKKYAVHLYAFVLMPNHWHLVVSPQKAGALAKYMQWITNAHVHRVRRHTQTVGAGHVYQERYRSIIVQSDLYFLSLCRYVERNPCRAALVDKAEEWQWSSVRHHLEQTALLSPWPIERPESYKKWINLEEEHLDIIQHSVATNRAIGSAQWFKTLPVVLRPKKRGRLPL
jgi:putative transposase